MATGSISVSIPNADGSITNLTASLAGCTLSITPPPVIIPPAPVFVTIPAIAKTVSLDPLANWKTEWDDSTPNAGTDPKTKKTIPGCSGSTSIVPEGRSFQIVTKAKGAGQRFSTKFGSDPDSLNWVYDSKITANWSLVTRMELDINQVTKGDGKTGQTIMMCQQATAGGSLGSGKMELTFSNTQKAWNASNVACDISKWADGSTHHFRLYQTRDAAGNVTYVSAELDGVCYLYAQPASTGKSIKSLGWASSVLIANWQMETLVGTVNAIATSSISRW